MPRPTLWAATVLVVGLSACSGPMKTSVPYGITYECDHGGAAEIRYNRGGFIPDQTVNATDREGQAIRVQRSTADLKYDSQSYRLVAEWTERGLRYRSENPVEGSGYLIWTQRGENARIGWRAERDAPDPRVGASEDPGDGTGGASCMRAGRSAQAGEHAAPAQPHHR